MKESRSGGMGIVKEKVMTRFIVRTCFTEIDTRFIKSKTPETNEF